jgi:hypothetical protein
MPKDMLDALIERLETEGDQYDHDFEPAERTMHAFRGLQLCALPMALAFLLGPARAGAGAFGCAR